MYLLISIKALNNMNTSMRFENEAYVVIASQIFTTITSCLTSNN